MERQPPALHLAQERAEETLDQLTGCCRSLNKYRALEPDRAQTVSELHLTAAVTHEDDWYVARYLQVEVASQGRSVEESLTNLREASEPYFEDDAGPTSGQFQPGRSH